MGSRLGKGFLLIMSFLREEKRKYLNLIRLNYNFFLIKNLGAESYREFYILRISSRGFIDP